MFLTYKKPLQGSTETPTQTAPSTQNVTSAPTTTTALTTTTATANVRHFYLEYTLDEIILLLDVANCRMLHIEMLILVGVKTYLDRSALCVRHCIA